MPLTLSTEDFARTFGITTDALPEAARDLISAGDFRYEPIEGVERDRLMLGILKSIESNQFAQVGEQRHSSWEESWSENLDRFRTNGSVDELVPRFVKPAEVLRLHRGYVRPSDPRFELNFLRVFRIWLFREFFQGADTIYEFGCGNGFNLQALAELYPQKRFYGLDWSAAAVQLVDLIGQAERVDMSGRLFDFFTPDAGVALARSSAVLTMCALEQVGTRHEAFLDFLLEQPIARCVHVEPVLELYDEESLVDYLAARYHRARGYLNGYLPRLIQLRDQGRIEIEAVRRLNVGSLYHEGHTLIVWRPSAHASRS